MARVVSETDTNRQHIRAKGLLAHGRFMTCPIGVLLQFVSQRIQLRSLRSRRFCRAAGVSRNLSVLLPSLLLTNDTSRRIMEATGSDTSWNWAGKRKDCPLSVLLCSVCLPFLFGSVFLQMLQSCSCIAVWCTNLKHQDANVEKSWCSTKQDKSRKRVPTLPIKHAHASQTEVLVLRWQSNAPLVVSNLSTICFEQKRKYGQRNQIETKKPSQTGPNATCPLANLSSFRTMFCLFGQHDQKWRQEAPEVRLWARIVITWYPCTPGLPAHVIISCLSFASLLCCPAMEAKARCRRNECQTICGLKSPSAVPLPAASKSFKLCQGARRACVC